MTAMRFEVRYGASLVVMTGLVIVALLGVFLVGMYKGPTGSGIDALPRLLMCALPLILLGATALFTVLRYEIDSAGLHVVRPIGPLCIASTVSTLDAPGALKGAIRTFGNGGLFSFNGWYWLRGYGSCRLWVTDLRDVVVLRGDRGCVVVSPAHRDAFIAAVRSRFGIAS